MTPKWDIMPITDHMHWWILIQLTTLHPKLKLQEQKQSDQPDHNGAGSEVRKSIGVYTRRRAVEKKKVLGVFWQYAIIWN